MFTFVLITLLVSQMSGVTESCFQFTWREQDEGWNEAMSIVLPVRSNLCAAKVAREVYSSVLVYLIGQLRPCPSDSPVIGATRTNAEFHRRASPGGLQAAEHVGE